MNTFKVITANKYFQKNANKHITKEYFQKNANEYFQSNSKRMLSKKCQIYKNIKTVHVDVP